MTLAFTNENTAARTVLSIVFTLPGRKFRALNKREMLSIRSPGKKLKTVVRLRLTKLTTVTIPTRVN